MTQTFLTGSPEYVDTVLTLWLSSQRLQILHLFTPNRCSLIFLAHFISCLSAHTACYQTDLFKYSPHSAQKAAICSIKMNCSLSYHLHFLIMLQGKKAGERMRGYEWKKICLSVWATVGLSAMKVKRKRRECSELWEETQRGITGSHAATEAWCCPDTLREAVTRGQSRTLRNKMWQ